ncbi:Hermansky-Pudlak syndrome 5 protein homolog [Athalia rosae]|uniref:Hermansky-Pudlak syndrome 5 protein homolog n=1 Tax=Athalia rosae TaxID=37344 RepID=UPI002033A95E|nr:Hermansky-Pudlak syndrome 5 protein homolog [Athalia rosae]
MAHPHDVTWDMTGVGRAILTEKQEITTFLLKPVKDKRRIKYTCFDVSPNYIALGSTSGGIYLFTRDTCVFKQLIPLSNGAVTHLSISPDEKVIALSTTDGNVCIVVFQPNVKEAIISSKAERNGECITTLCWNDNSTELYLGDANGTIHVMGLSIFTVKRGIFQDPACPIMGLDFKIVQMDFCSPLLLISTTSNCYLCDTIEGKYEKVGLRTRQGEFGACFFQPSIKNDTELFGNLPKHSSLNNTEFNKAEKDTSDLQFPRIFCARPGSRLWEANPNGKIVNTHNFKEALAIPPCATHKLLDSKPASTKSSQNIWPPQSLKFSPIHIVANQYLFTYNSNALYILDPSNSVVVLWTNEYTDLKTANVVGNHIYLMTNSGNFHCLELTSPDLPISNISLTSKPNISSKKLNPGIIVVNSRISRLKNDTKNTIIPEIERQIVAYTDVHDKVNEEITESQVQVLNEQNLTDDNPDTKEPTKYCDGLLLDVDQINIEIDQHNCTSQKNSDTERSTAQTDMGSSFKDEISNLISDAQTIYSLTNSISSSMSDNEFESITLALQKVVNNFWKSYGELSKPEPNVYEAIETAEQYYRNNFLTKLNKNRLSKTQNECVLNEAMKSFLTINVVDYNKCECGLLVPTEEIEEPKFLDIGIAILQRYSKESKPTCISLCEKVPYLWRAYVTIFKSQEDLSDERTFAQCLQTRNELILSYILPPLKKKQWEFAIKAINRLKLDKCVFCNRPIKSTDKRNTLSINWNNVANEIGNREGPDAAVSFLTRMVKHLPYLSLDKSIFQSLIFSKILNNHGFKQPMDFTRKFNQDPCDMYSSLCCPKIQDQLIRTLEKDLRRPIGKGVFGTHAHHWGMYHELTNSICPCCTLPLQTPVLLDNGLSIFPCGHTYHVNCLIQKKLLKCNLHH